jgi:hypothetical protein
MVCPTENSKKQSQILIRMFQLPYYDVATDVIITILSGEAFWLYGANAPFILNIF